MAIEFESFEEEILGTNSFHEGFIEGKDDTVDRLLKVLKSDLNSKHTPHDYIKQLLEKVNKF